MVLSNFCLAFLPGIKLDGKEGWQSGQMQRTVTPSGKPYIGSNPIPSTIIYQFPILENNFYFMSKNKSVSLNKNKIIFMDDFLFLQQPV